ncbi:MAG TPA: hypothetical protein PKD37_08090 [Oligoflexia bacterium]|nr:hypothetical protein [Oligoflexia bacterium]HMP27923.1 hypothetical protein [Oligoflexia bacterium]
MSVGVGVDVAAGGGVLVGVEEGVSVGRVIGVSVAVGVNVGAGVGVAVGAGGDVLVGAGVVVGSPVLPPPFAPCPKKNELDRAKLLTGATKRINKKIINRP